MADKDYVRSHRSRENVHLKTRSLTSTFTQNAEEAAELKKKRTFRKFSYRGIDLDQYVSTLHSAILQPPIPQIYLPTSSLHLAANPHPNQTPRPLLRTTPRRRARASPAPLQPGPEAQTDGPDQEAPQSETSRETEREARPG